MTLQRLVIRCDLNPGVGYSMHAFQIVCWLEKLGIYASVRPLSENQEFAQVPLDIRARIVRGPQPEPWELTIAPPIHLPTPGKRSVLWTLWESTVLPDNRVKNLNTYDLVVTSSEWNRDTFIRCGVKVPIFVVPLGCSDEWRSQPVEDARLPSKITIFGAAGRTAHGRERKGLDAVILAFKAAFPYDENVRLRIKCYPDCKLTEQRKGDMRIGVKAKHLSEVEAADWLWNCHCFVSAACGEGFGLWQLQAMSMRKSLICAAYGGLREFVGPHNAYLVHYREVPSAENFDGYWAQPDLGTMIEQMRRVHANREEAAQLGAFAAETVKGFTWENSARQLAQVLALAGAVTVQRQSFTRPAIQHIDYSPPPQPSLTTQAKSNGFTLEELRFEKREGEAVFNPSVALVNGELLWFARRSKMTGGDRPDSRIFAFHEKDFAAKETHVLGESVVKELPLGARRPIYLPQIHGDYFEDPRAVAMEDGIALSYVRVSKGHPACQELALLDHELNVTDVIHPDYGGNGRSSTSNTKAEKNWIFFQHHSVWNFIYWLEPMKVVSTLFDCARWPDTHKRYEGWRHGDRHGGGPPTKIGNEMFGFCHSRLPWFGQGRNRYFLSAYAFQSEPPFALTRLSREPFLASVDDVRGNPCSCVVCGGAVFKNRQWTLAVGAKDEQCLKLTMTHEWLLSTMESL